MKYILFWILCSFFLLLWWNTYASSCLWKNVWWLSSWISDTQYIFIWEVTNVNTYPNEKITSVNDTSVIFNIKNSIKWNIWNTISLKQEFRLNWIWCGQFEVWKEYLVSSNDWENLIFWECECWYTNDYDEMTISIIRKSQNKSLRILYNIIKWLLWITIILWIFLSMQYIRKRRNN